MGVPRSKTYRNKEESIKIIPLGGCKEIGKNCTLFEYKDEIIIIDCGVMFPETGMYGIDLVIPDMSYIFKNNKKVKAVLLTHGHEDHIGALPYLSRVLNVPIYGTKFTLGLVKNRLSEHGLLDKTELICVKHREPFKVGSFLIEMIRTTHSIADCAAILMETPIGKILHTGDFKIDHAPIDGNKFDFFKFAELGEKGLLALLSDSTNIEKEGFTAPERGIYKSLRKTFRKTKGRIFVATFASNIHRIQIIFDLAKEFNKKVAIAGRSMINNIEIARELGYLTFAENLLLSMEELKDTPKNKTILITTGTQGEPMSALSLLAHEKHKWLMIEVGDTVIISASVIPGNERGVSKIINNLLQAGANVVYEAFEDVHVSGHGYKEELKMMLSLTKPKYFIPVHGEYKNLIAHTKVAKEMGVQENRTLVMQNGDVIEISPNSLYKTGHIDVQQVYVDGKGVGDVGSKVIQDRQSLSEDGIVVAIVSMHGENGKLSYKSEIISRGFVYIKESTGMIDRAQKIILKVTDEYPTEKELDFSNFKHKIKSSLRRFFYNETRRKPMIVVRIIEK